MNVAWRLGPLKAGVANGCFHNILGPKGLRSRPQSPSEEGMMDHCGLSIIFGVSSSQALGLYPGVVSKSLLDFPMSRLLSIDI